MTLILQDRCEVAAIRWSAWPLSYAFYSWVSKVQERKDLLHKASAALFSYVGEGARHLSGQLEISLFCLTQASLVTRPPVADP